MGSHEHAHATRAREVGEWVARQGFHLLTGAGAGVMTAASRAFAEVTDRRGVVLGIVPTIAAGQTRAVLPGYPNPWVEVPIYCHLDTGGPLGDEPSSRNHINVLTSDVVILLPGADGTASEARLAIRYATPCIAFLQTVDEIPGLPEGVPVESDFANVASFVLGWTDRLDRRPDRAL